MSDAKPSADKEPNAPDEPAPRDPDAPAQIVPVDLAETLSLDRERYAVLEERLRRIAGLPAAPPRWKAAVAAGKLTDADVHALGEADAPMALCLSGGGIRSATFALGVLQGFARTDRLERFDYLSTVSGGGYAGSWLTAWQARQDGSTADDKRAGVAAKLKASAVGRLSGAQPPCDVAVPAAEPPEVRRLRAYSNYLSPALGLHGDLMALVAIFVRNLFLHWMVLLPALFALLMVPRLYLVLIDATARIAAASGAVSVLMLVGLAGLVLALMLWGAGRRVGALVALVFSVVLAALARWHATDRTALEPGWFLFAMAVFAVGISVAYMAADLPESTPSPGPLAKPDPPDRFGRWNHVPLLGASLLLTLLPLWLTGKLTLVALQLPSWLPGPDLNPTYAPFVVFGLGFALVHLIAAEAGVRWRRRRGYEPRSNESALYQLIVTLLVGGVGGIALLAAMKGLAALWTPRSSATPLTDSLAAMRELYAIVALPSMLAVFWLTVTLFAGATRRVKSEEDREWWARAAGLWLLGGIAWCVLAAASLVLPRLLLTLAGELGIDAAGTGSLTGGATVLGLLASAWGYWSRNGQKIIDQARGIVSRLNARLLDILSGVFIVLLAAVLGLALSYALELVENEGDPVSAEHATTDVGKRVSELLNERAETERTERCAAQIAKSGVLSIRPPAPAQYSASVPASACAKEKATPTALAAARFRGVLHAMRASAAFWMFVGLVGVALVMAYSVGTNTFSLHSMYGNRLIRAYLGASNPPGRRRPHPFTGFDPLDNIELVKLDACRPFPVINAALNLVQPSGDRLEWQQRKAASFTFTPFACGSAVLGYAPTEHYGRKRPAKRLPPGVATDAGLDEGSLTVGRAMAISGAAASPNMGYHSSTIVAFVMSFFNVRLGWWLPNPRVKAGQDEYKAWARDEPPAVRTLYAETFAQTGADSDFIYLSDGGHFENLGLYEMVRRRCRRIVVVDATQDAEFRHEDLLSSLRKIRIDFGIPIEFPNGLPSEASCQRHGGQPWAIGRIHYNDADRGAPPGSIVYLKPALWPGLPPDVTSYAARSRQRGGTPFPHQSTGDQFFDEAQFESYRVLGLLTVLKAFGNAPGPWLDGPGPDHREPGEETGADVTGTRSIGQRVIVGTARIASAVGAALAVLASELRKK